MSEAFALGAGRESARAATLTNRAVVVFVSFMMIAPSALFALHLRPAPAAALLAACAGAFALVLRAPAAGGVLEAPIDRRALAFAIVLAAALLVLAGAMHVFYAPDDWRIRDAVLGDMSAGAFPPTYDWKGADFVLRAPLGMYMIPAAVGRLLGVTAAHAVLFVQNSLTLGAIFYMLVTIGRGWTHLAVMILFAGCALLGISFFAALHLAVSREGMLQFGLDSWHPYFQYSGSLIQFFWVPNHALPGWWLAILLLLQARRQVDLATVAVTIGGALMWSPLAILPAAVWALVRVVLDWRTNLTSARFWLVAPVAIGFAPVAVYLTLGVADISRGLTADHELFWPLYALFVITQFLQIVFLAFNRERIPRAYQGLLGFCAIVLLALPLVSFGPSNDLVMRGSITALTIVAFLFGWVLLDPEVYRRPAWYIGVLLVVVCAPSAAIELLRATTTPRYPISDCSLFEASSALAGKGPPANYMVAKASVPHWLMRSDGGVRRGAGLRQCWPDYGYGTEEGASPFVPKTDKR